METVTIKRIPNRPGMWGVYIDGKLISDHSSRTAAATAANQHIQIQRDQIVHMELE